jgi:hypothetical protein
LFASRLTQFEDIKNSNLINILSSDEENSLTRETRPITYFFSFEKSMYQTISEEMLKMFSTILDFNNLVGEPVNKYRKDYKSLGKLRQLFFQKVQNEPDLDKYLDFYKWIDSAIGKFVLQLVPASADTSDGLLNVVESHALERNKVQYKFPTAEFKIPVIEAGAVSINKHLYNWRFGYRPLSNLENDNCFYWNERAERTVPPISSSNAGVNTSRTNILNTSLQVLNRSFTTPYRFNVEQSKQIKGGVNFEANKNIEFAKTALAPHGPLDTDTVINVPANYLVALIEDTSSLITNCNDEIKPNTKVKYYLNTFQGRDYLSSSLGYGEILSSKISLPLNLISSSINTGYQAQVEQQFMSGVVITNIHNDVYGSMNETPAQGPFTNAWVGGKQSRHVNINTGNDTYTTRAEAWKIVLGTLLTASYQTAIGFVGADYPYPEGNPTSPSYPVTAHKRATYFREETAKRPVNIKNIQTTTGSAVLGNYSNTYEVLHSVGSTTNNRELVDAINPTINTELSGIVRTNVTNGRVDFTLPTRQRSQTIIRNRFSAPGDYRTISRGYLTRYSEETSPYNSLPFRNRRVIGTGDNSGDRLFYQLAKEAGVLPLTVPGYGVFIQDSQSDIIDTISGSNFTLNQLQALPSNRGQMYFHYTANETPNSAIVPSIHKVNRNTVLSYRDTIVGPSLKVKHDNGFVTHAIPQKDAGYSWITQSLIDTSNPAFYGTVNSNYTTPTGSTSYTQTINTITSSVFGLNSNNSFGSENYAIPADFAGLSTIVVDQVTYDTLGSSSIDVSPLVTSYVGTGTRSVFNTLMLNRNGGYGYPSFKQTRTGNHKIVRKLNKDNYTSINNNGTQIIKKEPNVYFNTPFTTNIKDTQTDTILTFTYPYQNLLQNFEDPELYNNLFITNNNTFYDTSIKLLLNNRRYKLVDIKVANSVYPAKNRKSLLETKKRNNYVFSAWRDNRTDRSVNNQTSLFDITGTLIPTQSIWPMDNSLNNSSSLSNSAGGEGVLQNSYSSVHFGTETRITASVLYAHKHMNTSIESYKNKQAISAILPFSQSNTQITTSNGLFDGTTRWQTADNLNGPYEDSYDKWFEKIRAVAKDYSIVPEFIISDDEKILAVQRNELDNPYLNSLSLTGSTITDTTSSTFFDNFVKSDFINDIDKIKQDLNSVTDKVKISLSCDAIIKLNPKPELYPQYQTVKLADKFANSIKDYSKFWTNNQTTASINQRDFRTLITPMFAPGILFNTIKSGIAVDYPILTGTLSVSSSFYNSSNTELNYEIANHYFDKRLPFETLVEPENYLTTDIIDMEPHPSSSLNVTGSWTGQYSNNLYKFAMNNFLAESINFFLPDGKLTTLFSKPETQFKEVDPNLEYRALVRIYKTADNIDYYQSAFLAFGTSSADRMSYVRPDYPWTSVENITMYSRPTAFGPSCYGGETFNLSALTLGTSQGINSAFTPPYYDGSSWALLTFKPTGSFKYVPTLNEIINSVTSSYVRFDQVYDFTGATKDGPYFASRINENSMQLTASLNLFNVVNTQDVSLTNTDSSLTESASKVWAIQTKFETPILNFDPNQTSAIIESGSKVPTVGMWHQFGQLPDDDKGVYLQVMDIPESYILKGFEGEYVSVPHSESLNLVPQLTASLADIVGFNKTPVKLGQVANTKQIKEAVIAIPYITDSNNNINYIKLNDDTINYVRNQFFGRNLQTQTAQAIANANVSEVIKSQLDKMKNYVIPPKFDFINNENIDPIAMYLFEFSYNLTQDDLIKIWQGVQPNISVEFDKQNSVVEHELNSSEFLNVDSLTENLRWLVFKVKQKAKNNYYERVLTSIQEKEKKRINNLLKLGRKNSEDSIIKDINLAYSYNWPYDYFSLVELAKVNVEVKFENEQNNLITSISDETFKNVRNISKIKLDRKVPQVDVTQTPISSQKINVATTSAESIKIRNRR